ncbi:MAG: hypothetical protein WA667_27655 [Candidatus Nitrosopolaris sp.]
MSLCIASETKLLLTQKLTNMAAHDQNTQVRHADSIAIRIQGSVVSIKIPVPVNPLHILSAEITKSYARRGIDR